MRRWPAGLVYLQLALLAGCGGREVLQLPQEAGWDGWKVTGWKEDPGGSRIVTWGKKSATSESSPEWVTYQILPRPAWDSPETTMNRLKALAEQRCAGGVWHVLRREASDILYERKVANCPHGPDEVDIARIIYGRTEMVQLTYAAQGTELSPAQREEAMALLMGARLEPSPDTPKASQGLPPGLRGGGGGRRRGGGG